MTEVFEELQLSVGSLRQDRRAEGLHDLLDSDILVRELVSSGAVSASLVPAIAHARSLQTVERTRRDRKHPYQRAGDPST
jgi:hypothetical protein